VYPVRVGEVQCFVTAVAVTWCHIRPMKMQPRFLVLDLYFVLQVLVKVHMDCLRHIHSHNFTLQQLLTFFINISKLAQFICFGHVPKEAGVVLNCNICVLQILIARCTVTQRMSSPSHHCICQSEGNVNDGPVPTIWLHFSWSLAAFYVYSR